MIKLLHRSNILDDFTSRKNYVVVQTFRASKPACMQKPSPATLSGDGKADGMP